MNFKPVMVSRFLDDANNDRIEYEVKPQRMAVRLEINGVVEDFGGTSATLGPSQALQLARDLQDAAKQVYDL